MSEIYQCIIKGILQNLHFHMHPIFFSENKYLGNVQYEYSFKYKSKQEILSPQHNLIIWKCNLMCEFKIAFLTAVITYTCNKAIDRIYVVFCTHIKHLFKAEESYKPTCKQYRNFSFSI